jgi:hypothetical protein
MPHPFQCIASVTPQEADNGSFLLAACGPKLLSLSSKDGSIVSQWTADAAVSGLDALGTRCCPVADQRLSVRPSM